MRALALCVALVAGLCGCSERRASSPPAPPALAPCRPGDLARTAMGPAAFAEGWVQLKLVRCPGAAAGPAAALEVEGATTALAFQPGRRGAATLGILAARAGGAGRQRFELPDDFGWKAELVVLAPWTGGPPPRVETIRVVAR